MCGIAGVIRRQGTADRQSLERAAEQLVHRGPDDLRIDTSGRVDFIHTRLSIIDIAGGQQPLTDTDGYIRLVANGEIYNYLELKSIYGLSESSLRSASDCELIIAAYQQLGIEGFLDLHGMFAFALHDAVTHRVYLCRDRLGIKPLFYAKLADRVVFASEIKALLPLLPRHPDINPLALNQFLQNQFHTGRQTIFNGIYRVLPGEIIEIDTDLEMHYTNYWSAADVEKQEIGVEEALEVFDELFAQVMHEHMRADVPFGLFLSGGIDSGVLLSELTRQHPQPLRTFSIGYHNTQLDDELDIADTLAKHFKTDHHSLRVHREDLFNRIVHTVWATDDLMRDYACLPLSLLSEMAAQELKVVFSGEGGDEAFAGYQRYKPGIERFLKSLIFGRGGFRTSSQWNAKQRQSVFGPSLNGLDGSAVFKTAWSEANETWTDMQKSQYVDLTTALPDNLLVKADRIMMSFGLEGRVPFTDHRLVEFGLSLPDQLKQRDKKGKWLVRRWAESRLPSDHVSRPKRGFYVPVPEWMSGLFLDQLGQKLLNNKAIQEWFNPEGIKNLIKQQQTKQNASRQLWCLLQFAIWHKLFAEGGSVRPPSSSENPLDWL